LRAGLVTLLALLAAVPVASAHPLGQQHGGYRATVSNVQPPVLGLQVAVLGGDQRLRISNLTGKTILIVGPEGDPFLRFTTEAVYRFEPVTSRWHQVALGTTYVWAEPRISWTEESPPAGVAAAPGETHLIREWSVPGRVGGRPIQIRGFLSWAPHTGGSASAADSAAGRAFLIAFGLTALAILAATVLYAARRRTSSSSRSA
jgi:hypothetical protein